MDSAWPRAPAVTVPIRRKDLASSCCKPPHASRAGTRVYEPPLRCARLWLSEVSSVSLVPLVHGAPRMSLPSQRSSPTVRSCSLSAVE